MPRSDALERKSASRGSKDVVKETEKEREARDRESLYNFLLGFRVEKGSDHTHTSFARPSGAFYIPSIKHDEFMTLYKSSLARGEDLYLTEHHRHIGPVVIDLDFRFELTAEEVQTQRPCRRHDADVVREVVSVYSRVIADHVETPSEFDIYVTEKPSATMFKGLVKDGIHIVMPGVVTRPEVQLLARQDVLKPLSEALSGLKLANRIEDVVDEAVIERNNWMMYGSKKPQGEAYRVTRKYRFQTGVATEMPVDEQDYVDLLSIRNKYVELQVRPDREEALREFISGREEKRKRAEALSSVLCSSVNSKNNECDNLSLVCKLVDCLDPGRAESYNEWVRVGWCLRNIDHRLLEKWEEISKKSSKYVEGECARMWAYMRQGGLGIGTLHMWARQDSPEAYKEIIRSDLTSLLLRSASGTHHDVAVVVHHMFRYDYVCASIRARCWYEFRDHRWHETDSAYSLRKKISTDVFREYCREAAAQNMRAANCEDEDQAKSLADLGRKLSSISLQLKQATFKDNVMRECGELFKRDRFEELLDSDRNLIGFENGIYDLERHEFREGRPDDHVSFSTGNNYVPFNPNDAIVHEIRRFWESVHPQKDIRDYVLRSLASCLSGHTLHERFNIWTGSGSNAKSVSVDLFERAFGDYCVKFPVTLLTQKRAASNAATSEIARAKGKRFAVLQEPSEDEKMNIGLMKELTGGDRIMARQLYKEPIEFKPQFKMFLLCNHLPNVPSEDGGTWRRIRVVEFGSKFVECPHPDRPNEFPIDMDLPQKLNGWKEHFMSLLLDVYKRTCNLKLDEPEAVMRCTREYQRNNDHMADFMDTCLEKAPDPSVVVTLDDLYREFKEWVRSDNIPARATKKRDLQVYLDRTLQARGQVVSGRVHYRGVRVRDRGTGSAADFD